jgi:hypothetical protein
LKPSMHDSELCYNERYVVMLIHNSKFLRFYAAS